MARSLKLPLVRSAHQNGNLQPGDQLFQQKMPSPPNAREPANSGEFSPQQPGREKGWLGARILLQHLFIDPERLVFSTEDNRSAIATSLLHARRMAVARVAS